jgi:hypothetical protein
MTEQPLLYVRVTFWNDGSAVPRQTTVEGWMRDCKEGVDMHGNTVKLSRPAIEIHPGYTFDPNGWMWGVLLSDVISIVPATPPSTIEGKGDPCPPPAEDA